MKQAAALEVEGVSVHYRRHRVLDQLSFTVREGECFGLVGMNGAGKTTCLKGLLDFRQIDAGSIRIFGIGHERTEARGRLAFLPERFLPPYYLDGRDFLLYMARLRGGSLSAEQIATGCERLDLPVEALDRPARDFSKGMAQKLGLVSCLLSEQDLLILDEPMSGLDPKARLLAKRALHAERERGATLLFSTHMLSDVAELCDRMGVLHAGQLRFVGSPEQCLAEFGCADLEQAYLACVG